MTALDIISGYVIRSFCAQKSLYNECVCVCVARQGVLPLGCLAVALFIHSFIHFTSFIWSFIPGWTLRLASLHFRPVSCPEYESNFMLAFFWLLVAAIVAVVAACAAAAVTSCLLQRSSGTRTQAQSQFQFRPLEPFFSVNLSGREKGERTS